MSKNRRYVFFRARPGDRDELHILHDNGVVAVRPGMLSSDLVGCLRYGSFPRIGVTEYVPTSVEDAVTMHPEHEALFRKMDTLTDEIPLGVPFP